MFDELKFSRGLLSSYYIAAIFTYFLLQPDFTRDMLQGFATWIVSFLNVAFSVNVPAGYTWFVLFILTFAIMATLRRAVVYPLGFYINDEGAPAWELFIFFFIILGFFTYQFNTTFRDLGMPPSTPDILVRFLGGYKIQPGIPRPVTAAESITFNIVPWFWYVVPIAFMYITTKVLKDKDEK